MSETKLLPCPFCGGEARHLTILGRNGIACKDCLCEMRGWLDATPEEVACRWNTRKPIEKIVERLEEASFWTEQTFDEDGYGNDDSWEAVWLDKAIEIVKEEGGLNEIPNN